MDSQKLMTGGLYAVASTETAAAAALLLLLLLLLLQETEAAVDDTIAKVMAAVEPLEAAWQAELQRLQVGGV
jgi:hypothetical protein